MFTRTIVISLVVASVVYTECRPQHVDDEYAPTGAIKQRLINSRAFNDLIDQILHQISDQSTTLTPQEVRHVQDESHINVDALRASIFNTQALNDWIRLVWQQIAEQYEALTGFRNQSTKPPQTVQTSPPSTTAVPGLSSPSTREVQGV